MDSGDQNVSFAFLKAEKYEAQKPYYFAGPLPTGQEEMRTNLEYTWVDGVVVKNVRPSKASIKLDEHGVEFCPVREEFEQIPRIDDPSGITKYLEAVSDWLKDRLKANKVVVYDYRYRRSVPTTQGSTSQYVAAGTRETSDEPATTPHVDHTFQNALHRVRRHLTKNEIETYLDGTQRVRIVNLWRPISPTVENWPLAFCDWKTVDTDQDLIAADRVSEQYVGEVFYLRHSENHKWFYLADQRRSEMSLFVSFDTDPRDGAPFCPHSSFEVRDPTGGSESERQSIEIRAIVIS